jgi:dye decolorizing peroxidase
LVSRRGFLAGGAAAAASGAVGIAAGAAGAGIAAEGNQETFAADRAVDFYGQHQSGIELEIQAVTNMVALDLKDSMTKADMLRWMRLLTDDISRLARGEPVLADPAPELAIGASRFTAYVGFGPSLFAKLGLESQLPEGFADLPAFSVDQLEER